MENSINDPSRLSLEVAARALVGDQGVNVITELARLLDAAEQRGFERGQQLIAADWTRAYKRGYDDAMIDASWIDWPAQTEELVQDEDLRDPIINAHAEGEVYPDMTLLHRAENRSPISDKEAYEALEQHFGYYGE